MCGVEEYLLRGRTEWRRSVRSDSAARYKSKSRSIISRSMLLTRKHRERRHLQAVDQLAPQRGDSLRRDASGRRAGSAAPGRSGSWPPGWCCAAPAARCCRSPSASRAPCSSSLAGHGHAQQLPSPCRDSRRRRTGAPRPAPQVEALRAAIEPGREALAEFAFGQHRVVGNLQRRLGLSLGRCDRDEGETPLRSVVVDDQVARDREQPGMEVVAAKRAQLRPRNQQRFLRNVGGVSAVGDALRHEAMDVGRSPFYPMQVVLPVRGPRRSKTRRRHSQSGRPAA